MHISTFIAKELIRIEAVKISVDPPFTWVSGIKSPIYCDNRVLISYPELRECIVDEMKKRIQCLKPDYIAGTATAGIPWAAFVSQKMGLPMLYVRPEAKEHGAGKQIEGHLIPGKKVILVEDLISTGRSSLKAVKALRGEGKAIVEKIIAIVTYQMEKSVSGFQDAGITVSTLTDFEHLLEEVERLAQIPKDQIKMILEFKSDPVNWWDNFNIQK